jgi:hypothetical protein
MQQEHVPSLLQVSVTKGFWQASVTQLPLEHLHWHAPAIKESIKTTD